VSTKLSTGGGDAGSERIKLRSIKPLMRVRSSRNALPTS
jgi:hypothetical protein